MIILIDPDKKNIEGGPVYTDGSGHYFWSDAPFDGSYSFSTKAVYLDGPKGHLAEE